MTRSPLNLPALVCAALACSAPSMAQAPPPATTPEPTVWTVSAGAGLALTSGNTDTSTVNASYEVIYDPQTRYLLRSNGLMIRGKNEGDLSADRVSLNVRSEFRLNERAYVFVENRFLRDRFKSIDYLTAPAGGLGYGVIETPETKMSIDVGLGRVWEKNANLGAKTSGSLTVGQSLAQMLTTTTSLTQSFSGLWKISDFGDALQIFGIGVSATVSSRTQLKIELLDTYKRKPPVVTVQKNDVAVLIAIVYKM